MIGRTSVIAYRADDEVARGHRPRARRRLSGRELDPLRRRAASDHVEADSRRRSGAGVVLDIRQRAGQPAGVPARALQRARDQIHLTLSPQRLGDRRRQTRDAEAYHLYLQGRYFFNQLTPATSDAAVECYRTRDERDPEYALAWSGIADAHASSPISGDATRRVVGAAGARRRRSAVAAAKPELAAAQHVDGASALLLDWNWPKADARIAAGARDRSRNLAYGHRMLAILLCT